VFDFAWPWLALLLPLPVLVWRLSRPAPLAEPRERRITLLHPALRELDAAFATRRPGGLRRAGLRPWLLALAWAALVVALMRPQWLEPHTESRAEGYDLMLAVDASHSMDALDFASEGQQVTRMSVVKGVMGRFIEQRSGDRIGLIVFGSQAFVLSPLTLDRDAVRTLLDDLVTSIAGQGTAIGDALGVGVKRLRHRPEGSRVLVLVTDGENTAGTIPPLEAARLAATEGVRIYVIGVGSQQAEVSIVEDGRLIRRNDLGFEEDTLREIARVTDGAYFRATDTEALEQISARINELAKSEAETRTVLVPQPLYRWPLAVALLALLGLGLLPGALQLPWGSRA
jgi:Ca-activated chloride channel family protein